jgi:regulation of enolase protein 1 (concanavalin A-like superfamily)
MKNNKLMTFVTIVSSLCTGLSFFALAQKDPPKEETIGTAAISLADVNQKVMFADRFTSPLSARWYWIREDPKAWKVENGTLLLRSLPGYVYLDSNNAPNVLLRKAPVTSKVLVFEVYLENRPKLVYEHAGLYWYYDDDNYVCLLKEQMGKEVRLRVVREKDATATFAGESKYDAKGVWFRLVIADGKATGYYRPTDKGDWRKMAQVDLPSEGEPKVGLNAGGGPQNAKRWVRFSHFRILEKAE